TEPDLPARVSVPPPSSSVPPPPPPPSGGWVPGIADSGKAWPPTMDIRKPGVQIQRPQPLDGPPPPPIRGEPAPPTSRNDASAVPATPLRVPSCVLVGRQLHNLALHDLAGNSWQFKTSRKGKLVLFDFWMTTCIPCRESMPHLRELQA